MNRSAGYTLLELIIAMASASALMAGLSGALLISSYALDIDEGASVVRASADTAMARLTADTRHALKYTERSATAIEFTVPDRDGDDEPETLRYAWGGAEGDSLTRTRNGISFVVLRDIHDFSLTYTERLVPAVDVTVEPAPKWPVVESFSLQQLTALGNTVSIPLPAGTVEGNLLIATVVTTGNESGAFFPPHGWALLHSTMQDNKVTLAVWWKLAGAGEPVDYEWRWGSGRMALGWIVRISNQWTGVPITAFLGEGGNSQYPECLSVTSALDHSLVLRMGGFEGDKIDVGDPGLYGHTHLLMEASGTEVSGGCGYKVLQAAGSSSQTNFDLLGKKKFRTLSVLVIPNRQ